MLIKKTDGVVRVSARWGGLWGGACPLLPLVSCGVAIKSGARGVGYQTDLFEPVLSPVGGERGSPASVSTRLQN